MTRNDILPISIYQISAFLPDTDAYDYYINWGPAGLCLEGFKSMQIKSRYKNGIEQIATADLLVVMLFANASRINRQKVMPTGAGS